MQTLSTLPRRARQITGAFAITAAAMLVVAPMAGASNGRSDTAPHGESETAPHGNPPAHAQAGPAGGSEQPEPGANRSETGAAASEAKGDNRSDSARAAESTPRNEQRRSETSRPNNGSAEPTSPGNSGPHKHTICHRTRSATNPYVMITVDFHAVDGEIADSHGDHAERHGGPVFDPATMGNGDAWGDIIPPFTTPDGASYGGMNWTAAGQAVFDAGCEIPTPAPAEVEGEETESQGPGAGVGAIADETVVGGVSVVAPRPDGAAIVRGDVEVGPSAEVLGSVVVRSLAAPAAAVGDQVGAERTAVSGTLPRTGDHLAMLGALGMALIGAGYVVRQSARRDVVAG